MFAPVAMAMSPSAPAPASASANCNGNLSPRKDKTILNWLKKSSSASHDSVNNNNNPNPNSNNDNNCNCETRAFRDFRGVQTLRLLWSKRIHSASEDHHHHHQQQQHQLQDQHAGSSSLGTLKKLNKSVSCLVNAFNNARDWPLTPEKTLAKRSASLHNLQQQQQQQDNFYKYKNAEQAKMHSKLKRANCSLDETMIAVAKEKSPKKGECKMEEESTNTNTNTSSKCLSATKSDNKNENCIQILPDTAAALSLSATSAQSGGSSESLRTNSTSTSSVNHSTLTSSGGGGGGGGRAISRRKYSFKTHAGKSYHQHHTPRRMSSNLSSSSSIGSASQGLSGAGQGLAMGHETLSRSGNSMVAKLTQQFNEIIQKDARVLEQVKRNNGVWLARGGHVYKIVEKTTTAATTEPNGTVQRNIKKFEKLEKPAVPLKSQQLLRRHQELLARSGQNKAKRNSKLQALEVLNEEPKIQIETHNEHPNVENEIVVTNKSNASESQNLNQVDNNISQDKNSDDEFVVVEQQHQEEVENVEEVERQKQRKHKYATIYEKLRFTFQKGRKSPTKATSPLHLKVTEEKVQQQSSNHLTVQDDNASQSRISPCVEADSKILDALEVLDQKLKVLSLPSNDNNGTTETVSTPELLLAANDDFEQRILPNNSFIYQAANKQISNNQILINQAVNVTLVNAIEGEQMIMEQKQLAKLAAKDQKEEDKDEKDEVRQPSDGIETTTQLETESIYEPITLAQLESQKTDLTQQASSLFKISSSQKAELNEDIYQTVEEAAASTAQPTTTTPTTTTSLEGYESIAGSRESRTSGSAFDGYESFAEASQVSQTSTGGTQGGRNTRDELPELPKPKRNLPKSPQILRPAPAKPDPDPEDENIYDTIKGCYESMSMMQSKVLTRRNSGLTNDSISINSNCYESIPNCRRSKLNPSSSSTSTITNTIQLSSSGSTLTISSDHKTNSLYESSLVNGVGCRTSLGSGGSSTSNSSGKPSEKRSSIAGSSDNSDAWVDISDGDGDGDGEGQAEAAEMIATEFIVVREQRFKPHRNRSPDWSKRIRDKRLQQKKAISCIEDDSDHYYETLSPLGHKRHSQSTQLISGSDQNVALRSSQRRIKHNHHHSVSAHALGEHLPINSDDYDSFETDSDEPGEQEQRLRNQNDSGVDISNHRLPKPPAAQQNQVYEFVRKFKDFISNKKSPKSSQQKLYENTSPSTQFYVESNCKPKTKSEPEEIYDNTEQIHLSPSQPATLMREKQKNGKSLRSRLRKSLVGSTFDTKQLSALTATRSTFYIEDPERGEPAGSGNLDSGFSEKNSSGDLPSVPSMETQKFSTVARKAKKEAKASRRRTTIGLRPHDPPPPPPPLTPATAPIMTSPPKSPLDSMGHATSWYAECGVFKQSPNGATHGEELVSPTTPNGANGVGGGGASSWYAESGLYQTSGISVASSSGSSGVSTGNEAGLGDDLQPHSLFSNEPLYQMYSAAKLESITRDLEAHESSTDGYEEIGQNARRKTEQTKTKPRPSALQLVEPKNGPSRTLWSEIPEVIHSCILPTLTPRERGLQEAKFEIITSEASYLKSLNLLRRHFMNNSAFMDSSILSPRDRKALFSYIVPVHECSERLLTELECCWQNNIMLLGLSRCIYEIAEKHFHVYVAFCEHQGRMDRTLRRLKEAKSGSFQMHLEKLEANPNCCGLNLHSFLMLPMQRITRLPLLIDAVFSKESPLNQEEYESWKLTLALVQKIVAQCNEAANRWEQAYELERISKQLEFPTHIRALAIAPCGVPKQGAKPRFLVKRGELTHLMWRGDDAKLTFGKRFTKSNIYAFLFSDLLVLTKRKGETSFTVYDYCPRSMMTLSSGDSLPQLPTKDLKDQAGKNLMLMTLLENHERKTVELVLSCPSISDQQRWLQVMRPPEAETPDEKLYESWDCPQVIAKYVYETDEPDELHLETGDVVNVTRKLKDGWYQGERIRDGAVGWFPGNYTEELNSAHVRSRNLKQRHRLLTFTATFLESQNRK
ncbi:uncharacterized protein Dwil_GK17141 [Drosophila willistoni]|uniref:Uncharacterized protein n=1 Tax=Drosophila willistoni TaxID=7260 RepID=A0A0Q9WP26_DROWI|nr:uncharacterized protein Dwil_GK17141 [Drosophila willistoni]